MYKASITQKGERVSITVRDDDAPSEPVQMLSLSADDALMMRLWLIGLHDQKAPFEFEVSKQQTYWLDYEVWVPMRDALNIWYEANYDRI